MGANEMLSRGLEHIRRFTAATGSAIWCFAITLPGTGARLFIG